MNEIGNLAAAALACQKAYITKQQALAAVHAIYGTRWIEGFEVVDGWEMPEAPQEGLIACAYLDNIGVQLFWWYVEDEGNPKPWRAPKYSHWPEIPDPLVSPDTGVRAQDCLRAYEALGFRTCR
jgi:hypothetical protein